jgi:hypothetical protein
VTSCEPVLSVTRHDLVKPVQLLGKVLGDSSRAVHRSPGLDSGVTVKLTVSQGTPGGWSR